MRGEAVWAIFQTNINSALQNWFFPKWIKLWTSKKKFQYLIALVGSWDGGTTCFKQVLPAHPTPPNSQTWSSICASQRIGRQRSPIWIIYINRGGKNPKDTWLLLALASQKRKWITQNSGHSSIITAQDNHDCLLQELWLPIFRRLDRWAYKPWCKHTTGRKHSLPTP